MRSFVGEARACLLLVIALGVMTRDARADDARPMVESAESLYAELSYADANRVAERLTREQGLSHDLLVRSYRILALTHAILDHTDAARAAFIALLTYDPGFPDPKLSPRIQAPYMEARGLVQAQSARPAVTVAAHARSQDTSTLRVTTHDPTRIVTRVSVGYRWGAAQRYTVTSAVMGDAVLVEVPAPPPNMTRLDYYAQALDARSNVVFESGNPASPKSALVELDHGGTSPGRSADDRRESSSMFASPAFWVVTALFLAGGATATYLVTRPRQEDGAAASAAIVVPVIRCGEGAFCR